MKRNVLLTFLLFAFAVFNLNAQGFEVTGTVTSADDGSALPGVSVVVQGTTIGAVTDFNGTYSITVPEESVTLMFSFVGMVTQEVPINGRTVINVVLEASATALDEVVVTALGMRKEQKTLGYSATQVSNEVLSKSGTNSAMSALQGRVAGVAINDNSGAPGSSTKVIIRGYTSIGGNNNPLYVVDGVPIDNAGSTPDGFDFGNGANGINPEDIESINILKGAAATALYGNRAANGAIIITSKSGKGNDKLKVDYTNRTSFTTPLRIQQFQDVFGEGWSGHFAYEENGSWGPKMDGKDRLTGNIYNNTQQVKPFAAQAKNVEEFYDVGTDFYNSLALSGSQKNTSFYSSFSNTRADGYLPTNVDAYNRNTLKLKAETSIGNLTLSGSADLILRNGSNTPDGYGGTNSASNIYSELLQVPRDKSVVDWEDYKNNPFNTLDYFYTPYATNPYYALNENQSKFNENRTIYTFSGDYKIAEWLHGVVRLGQDVTNFQRKEWEAIMTFDNNLPNGGSIDNPGYMYEYAQTRSTTNMDAILMGNTKNDDLSFDYLVGYNLQQRSAKSQYGQINSLTIPYYYNLSNTDGTKSTGTAESLYRLMGTYAQATIGYQNFLYLNLSARNDWSSTLPQGNNTFFYPSASISFLLNEVFPEVTDVLSFGKLRASWGKAGNDAAPYLVKSVFIPGNVYNPFGSYPFPVSGVNGFEISNRIGNPSLVPEISTEWEIGADLRFFENRIGIDAAYYNKLTDGQILEADIAPSSGYTSQVKNFGVIRNSGIELLLNVIPVKSGNFEWDITLNYTKNHNIVEELTEGLDEYRFMGIYNTEFVAIPGQPLGVVKVPGIETDDEGHTVVNPNTGFPVITAELEEVGSVQPNYIMGITNTFKIYGVEVGFTFDYRNGGYMYSGTADLHYFAGNATQTLFNERQPFMIPNSVMPNPSYDEDAAAADPNYDVPMYVENTVGLDMSQINNPLYYPSYNTASERDRIIPKDYLKLRELTLSYSLPSSLLDNIFIDNLSIILTGRNLLIWTPSENNFVDPEVTSFGNDLTGEFGEFRTGPSARTFTAGIRVNF
jgi:TonB-linked SusC/RagA family outer membrane protein